MNLIKKTISLLMILFVLSLPNAVATVSTDSCYGTDAVLMMHMDGSDTSTTFSDDSTSAHTMTANGNAQIKTAQSKFGGSSGYFDGTGDYVSTGDSNDWDFGTGDFTIEAWIRLDELGPHNTHCFAGNGWNASGWMVCPYFESNFYVFHNGSLVIGQASVAISAATWYHVAVVRSGTTLAIYLNGTQLTTATYGTSISGSTSNLDIGDDSIYHDTGSVEGYVDELRIVKGTAIWTSSFTPSSSAYTACTTRRRILITTID